MKLTPVQVSIQAAALRDLAEEMGCTLPDVPDNELIRMLHTDMARVEERERLADTLARELVEWVQ